MSRMLSLFGALFLITACQTPGEPAAGSGSVKRGTEQGNGLVTYSNAQMGITFQYPADWLVRESGDYCGGPAEVSLTNGPFNAKFPLSRIQFCLRSDFNGRKVLNLDQLLKALMSEAPSHVWLPAEIAGNQGYRRVATEQDGAVSAEYYLLDANHNILQMAYTAYEDHEGLKVITSIIGQLEPHTHKPVLRSVTFDPPYFVPGKETQITFQIDSEDEVGLEFGLGYDLPFIYYPVNYEDLPQIPNITYKPAYEVAEWQGYGGKPPCDLTGKCVFHVKLPVGAPEGKLVVTHLRFGDTWGNEEYFSAAPDFMRPATFQNCRKADADGLRYNCRYGKTYFSTPIGNWEASPTSQPLIRVPVNAPVVPYKPAAAPKVLESFFDRTLLTSPAQAQRLFVRVQSAAGVSDIRGFGPLLPSWDERGCGSVTFSPLSTQGEVTLLVADVICPKVVHDGSGYSGKHDVVQLHQSFWVVDKVGNETFVPADAFQPAFEERWDPGSW